VGPCSVQKLEKCFQNISAVNKLGSYAKSNSNRKSLTKPSSSTLQTSSQQHTLRSAKNERDSSNYTQQRDFMLKDQNVQNGPTSAVYMFSQQRNRLKSSKGSGIPNVSLRDLLSPSFMREMPDVPKTTNIYSEQQKMQKVIRESTGSDSNLPMRKGATTCGGQS